MKISLIEIWKERGAIFEGVKNKIFKQEHIEEIAEQTIGFTHEFVFYKTHHSLLLTLVEMMYPLL